jgi:hypothetical protein
MTDPKITKQDAQEAFFNLGKLAGKLSSDDGKRLYMLTQIVASYMAHLEERPVINEEDGLVCAKCYKKIGEADFDMDGRC